MDPELSLSKLAKQFSQSVYSEKWEKRVNILMTFIQKPISQSILHKSICVHLPRTSTDAGTLRNWFLRFDLDRTFRSLNAPFPDWTDARFRCSTHLITRTHRIDGVKISCTVYSRPYKAYLATRRHWSGRIHRDPHDETRRIATDYLASDKEWQRPFFNRSKVAVKKSGNCVEKRKQTDG